ncbi:MULTISPECIES: MerR family transcriptional regulator [unclassified Nocardiopsis]|uniref:MerR family transcriptional regulator n=1 Tax=unclassified Nocardiopsis TaxID=2649073 RepID=UPI001358E04B|nr:MULTISPECIES: MerR family transcriptional regulator [unclassified Nocardiopsis]
MRSSEAELSIGELAETFGLAPHVLRHWESVGVLEPSRRSGGQRRYTPDHRLRVALVLRAQAAGFSLAQIRELIDAPDCEAQRGRVAEHLARLDERMEQLRTAREMVAHVMACEADHLLECPKMRAILEEGVAAPGSAEPGGRVPLALGAPGRTG